MHVSPTVNRNSEMQYFEHNEVIKIHNGIMLVFYPGLPHIIISLFHPPVSNLCGVGISPQCDGYGELLHEHRECAQLAGEDKVEE